MSGGFTLYQMIQRLKDAETLPEADRPAFQALAQQVDQAVAAHQIMLIGDAEVKFIETLHNAHCAQKEVA